MAARHGRYMLCLSCRYRWELPPESDPVSSIPAVQPFVIAGASGVRVVQSGATAGVVVQLAISTTRARFLAQSRMGIDTARGRELWRWHRECRYLG